MSVGQTLILPFIRVHLNAALNSSSCLFGRRSDLFALGPPAVPLCYGYQLIATATYLPWAISGFASGSPSLGSLRSAVALCSLLLALVVRTYAVPTAPESAISPGVLFFAGRPRLAPFLSPGSGQ